MSVELVNGHVLFPNHANRIEEISWQRAWRGEVSDSEFGNESRYALRKNPRSTLEWKVSAFDVQADAQIVDRILAAKQSGKSCAPRFGRGCKLASPVAGTAVVLNAGSLWVWSVNDYCIFIDDIGHEVRQIQAVVGANLTLDSAVRAHADFIWPMIFGKFSAGGFSVLTPEAGEAILKIDELSSQDVATVGTADPPINGIGGWIIGDTFEVQ